MYYKSQYRMEGWTDKKTGDRSLEISALKPVLIYRPESEVLFIDPQPPDRDGRVLDMEMKVMPFRYQLFTLYAGMAGLKLSLGLRPLWGKSSEGLSV